MRTIKTGVYERVSLFKETTIWDSGLGFSVWGWDWGLGVWDLKLGVQTDCRCNARSEGELWVNTPGRISS